MKKIKEVKMFVHRLRYKVCDYRDGNNTPYVLCNNQQQGAADRRVSTQCCHSELRRLASR